MKIKEKSGIKFKKINGYIFILVGSFWMPEHRLVVEEKLGRLLTPEEVIHHIDFDKSNNKVENLMLFPTQREHTKFHLKLTQFGVTNPIKRQIEEMKV